jgi:hypothetical protein
MKTALILILEFALSVGFPRETARTVSASSGRIDEKATKKGIQEVYDGAWWLAADPSERTGFLDGASDCLLSKAHEKWPANTRPEMDQESITLHYKTNPKDVHASVADVWRKTASKSTRPKPVPGSEVYTNPHGYFDGEFWREGSELANRGFLEGYLWCIRTCVKEPTETYSQSIDYYWTEIWDYLRAHPKTAYNEAIADILSRFRDRPKPT